MPLAFQSRCLVPAFGGASSAQAWKGDPLRTIHNTASTNIRLSRPVEPFWSGRPMMSDAIRSKALSLSANRSAKSNAIFSKAALN